MKQRLVFVCVLAALPVLASAQGTKLVNCRTLEAAGNFVGPDEVIDNDMVCQKVLVGAAEAKKLQPPKPLPGAVISNTEPTDVVEAAKAAKEREKRAEEAREAAKEKPVAAPETDASSPAPSTEPATPAPAPVTPAKPEAAPVAPAPPAAKPEMVFPAKPPAREVAATGKPAPGPGPPAPSASVEAAPVPVPAKVATVPAVPEQAVAARAPIEKAEAAPSEGAKDTAPESVASAPVAAGPAAAAPSVRVENADSAPPEVALAPVAARAPIEKAEAAPSEGAKGTAPESVASAPVAAGPAAAAPSARVENTDSAPPEVALAPVAAPVAPATRVTPAPRGAETIPPAAAAPAIEKVNGFYDANVGNTVVTVAPAEGTKTSSAPAENPKTTFTTPEPMSPPPEAAPPASTTEAPVATAPAMVPQVYPDEEREHVVKMGAFVEPKEEGDPDPTALAHKTTFLPGDQDGFHEGQRPGCAKNITLGSLKGEKLVLGTPEWAEKWIEKNQKRMPQVCFSDTPMQEARNYLIVFYTTAGAANGAGLSKAALTTVQGTPASGVGTFTLSYGSTWHYSYDRTVGITVLTRDDADEPHGQPGQALSATAYSEEGVPVAEHWPPKAKKQVKADPRKPKQVRAAREVMEQVSSELLGELVDDIGKL